MLAKVLVSDAVHPLLIEGLEAANYHCDYMPKVSLTEVLAIIEDYQGIIINSKIIVDKHFLDKAQQLKFIARLGSGMEIVDQDYAREKGIAVYRSPEGNCDAVAEQAMGMLLALAIQLKKSDNEVREHIWRREENRGWELMDKTIGIIGFGHTGQALAKRLSGFGMRILVYDKYKSNYTESWNGVEECSEEYIFQEADILSLHLPLSEETIGKVDRTYLEQFKKDIVLVNTSRGSVVNTKDLIAGLESRKVRAAALDVYENEKPKSFTLAEKEMYDRLFAKENVLFSPHVAGWTVESKERLAKILLNRILNG